MDLTIDYNEQMLDYYPEVIKSIREFRYLIETQSLQIEELHEELIKMLDNAYIATADEERLAKWEKMLDIKPLPQGDDDLETWLSDRRETILARLYNTPKLNTAAIADIVKIFTSGSATSYFEDGTIFVLISPPGKQYKFANVEQELRKKIPAHLALQVQPNYLTWKEVQDANKTWDAVRNAHTGWDDVLYYP